MKWDNLMDLKGAVVNVFEDFFERNEIEIPNADRDAAEADGAEGCAIIYANDYDEIANPIETLGVSFGLDCLDPEKDVEISIEEAAVEIYLDKIWSGFLSVANKSTDLSKVYEALHGYRYGLLKKELRDVLYRSGIVKVRTHALCFHNAEDGLPDDDALKVVICRTQKGVLSWNRAYYAWGSWHGSGSMSGVIAWANLDVADVARGLGLSKNSSTGGAE